MEQNPQSQLKLLVTRGKEQGYLTYAEVNDHLPEDIVDSDQIEDIIQMIEAQLRVRTLSFDSFLMHPSRPPQSTA